MTKEQFIAIGLTEELATKAAEESKKELETYIPKTRFDEVNTAKKEAEKQVKERDTQLEELKKVDAAGLQAEITRLQEENKTKDEQYKKQLKDMQMSNAIKLAVTGKAHDEELVTGLIDKTKLILGEDGKVTGLEEQLKVLQESKTFLFKQDEQQPPQLGGVKPTNTGGAPKGITKEQFSKMSYADRVGLYNTQPELYQQLTQ